MFAKLVDGVKIDGPKLSDIVSKLVGRTVYVVDMKTNELCRIYIVSVDNGKISARITMPMFAGMMHGILDGDKYIVVGVEI